MSHHITHIHTEENDPAFNLPYTPAIKVTSGSTVYIAGVTAAPVYHHHPHIPSEFENIPLDPAEQTRLSMENLINVLHASGGEIKDIVQLFRFIVDIEKNQDPINRVMAQYLGAHRSASTTVEVVRLATDPRLVVELSAVAVIVE